MDHDLRYDADDQPEATQYGLPSVPAATASATVPAKQGSRPGGEPDCTIWTQTVNHRLARLEAALERIADHVQVLILRLDDGK